MKYQTHQQSSLFFRFLKDFQSLKSCMNNFRLPEIGFEKLIFELSSQIIIKVKEINYLLKNQQFFIDYIPKKKPIDLMRKHVEMLLVVISFLVLLVLALFPIFTANNLSWFIFAISSVYILEKWSP